MECSVSNEVLSLCLELGHLNALNGVYALNAGESSSCVRQLIRLLRNDCNDTFAVRRQMGVSNIVHNDLIPIVEQHCLDDIPLFDKVLRLLVDLSNPTILHFKQKLPKEKSELQLYMQLESYLFAYKLSFGANRKVWSVLGKHMTRILDLDDDKRQIEDGLLLERILILVRNVLHIAIDCDRHKGTEEEANPHDRIIEAMAVSGVDRLLLRMSNSDREQEFCFHLIEIISLMLREQNAQFLAQSVADISENRVHRNHYEKELDRQEMIELRQKDESKLLKSKTLMNRFQGAAYCLKNVKSISDRDLIYHKIPTNLNEIKFETKKTITRKPKHLQPMRDNSVNSTSCLTSIIHRSSYEIRKILHNFCFVYLESCYNNCMHTIRSNLSRNNSQENDETYFLWALQFFTEFNRCHPKTNDISLVNETMCVTSFHYLHTQIEHYLDFMRTQKQDLKDWSKRLHYALKAYRELLFTLFYSDSTVDEYIKRSINDMKHNIFYEVEYRDLLIHLFHDYDEVKMSKAFLKDLIETNHMFLKMLEYYCKTNSRVVVKKIVKKRKPKKDKTKNKEKNVKPSSEQLWSEIDGTLSDGLQGKIELPSPLENIAIRAYDPTSDKTSDEQKMDVMRRIHNLLAQKSALEAIALYRDARNVWSGDDDEAFGSDDILPEDELIALNQILMTEFPEEPTNKSDNEKELEDETNELVEDSSSHTREVDFVFQQHINKYCHPSVLKGYALLLKNFETNSNETNHCIVKMLHRIAFDCKMHAMLFQASLFRTFQSILSYPLQNLPIIKELSKFAKFIISKFITVANKNKKVFVEILFWKSDKEANNLEEGYVQPDISKSKRSKKDKNCKSDISDSKEEFQFDDSQSSEGQSNSFHDNYKFCGEYNSVDSEVLAVMNFLVSRVEAECNNETNTFHENFNEVFNQHLNCDEIETNDARDSNFEINDLIKSHQKRIIAETDELHSDSEFDDENNIQHKNMNNELDSDSDIEELVKSRYKSKARKFDSDSESEDKNIKFRHRNKMQKIDSDSDSDSENELVIEETGDLSEDSDIEINHSVKNRKRIIELESESE